MSVPIEPPAAPASAPTESERPPPDRSVVRSSTGATRSGVTLVLVAGLAALALAVRLPHLWTVPRFTDETLEVLHSLAIVRDGARPLTNYDSYYGALYNYLVALALLVTGESPLAPRAVVLVGGVATVIATYFLGVEVGRRIAPTMSGRGRSVEVRLVGLLAAGLLATNGPHVIVNSHIAWSNCLTPLLTTLAFWAVLRSDRGGFFLPLAGLLLGLALQTHPLVVALLPGVALAVLLRDWRIVRTPAPWLAALLFLVGYVNVLVYNAEQGFESLRSAQRMQAEYAQDDQAAAGYLPTAASMFLLLARILGGAVDHRETAMAYLLDPGVLVVSGLSVAGVGLLAARREPLPLFACLSFLLILPAANPKFQTLLTTRYLMPIVPLLLACACAALVVLVDWFRRRAPLTRRRPLLATLVVGLLLIGLQPIALDRYYQRTFERTDTNERILTLVAEIETARRPDEIVLVDESIGSELPDTGVTEVRGLEYLLTFEGVRYHLLRPSPGRLQDSLDDHPTVLAILNARDAAAAESRLRVESLDPRPPVETGRMYDFRLYRLSRDRG